MWPDIKGFYSTSYDKILSLATYQDGVPCCEFRFQSYLAGFNMFSGGV